MKCRHCNGSCNQVFADLFHSPAANSFLEEKQLLESENTFPLKVVVCDDCKLVQVDELKQCEDIFNQDYVYYSSFSKSWLAHAKNYVDKVTDRFGFNKDSFVIEIASNDGYLLRNFVDKSIPCLGVEPSSGTAEKAKEVGVQSICEFFGNSLVDKLNSDFPPADLMIGNNVLAHVPDINDFVSALPKVMSDQGVVTFEFPHLQNLVEKKQFDTIYHEHFSYLSFFVVKNIFAKFGLRVFDVEEIPTHGGSLRVYGCKEDAQHETTPAVQALLSKEEAAGMMGDEFYQRTGKDAFDVKTQFLSFLLEASQKGKKVCGFGAAAKGNTLINYCGVKADLIDFVADSSPFKQNLYLPGSHIPVVHPDKIREAKPDYVILFPWNLKKELTADLDYIREWGGKFVIPLPELEVF